MSVFLTTACSLAAETSKKVEGFLESYKHLDIDILTDVQTWLRETEDKKSQIEVEGLSEKDIREKFNEYHHSVDELNGKLDIIEKAAAAGILTKKELLGKISSVLTAKEATAAQRHALRDAEMERQAELAAQTKAETATRIAKLAEHERSVETVGAAPLPVEAMAPGAAAISVVATSPLSEEDLPPLPSKPPLVEEAFKAMRVANSLFRRFNITDESWKAREEALQEAIGRYRNPSEDNTAKLRECISLTQEFTSRLEADAMCSNSAATDVTPQPRTEQVGQIAALLVTLSESPSPESIKINFNWKHAVILGAAVVTVGLTCAFLFVPSFAVLTTSLIVAAKALLISGLNIALNGIVAASVTAKALAISGFSIASANVLAAATVAKTFVASGLAMAVNGVIAGFNVALAGIQTLGHVFMPAVSNTVAAVIGSSVIAAGATLVSGAVIGATLLIKSRRTPVEAQQPTALVFDHFDMSGLHTVSAERDAPVDLDLDADVTPAQTPGIVQRAITTLRSLGKVVAGKSQAETDSPRTSDSLRA